MIDVAPEVIPDGLPGVTLVRKLRQIHDRVWENFRFLKRQGFLEGNRLTEIQVSAGVPIEIAHKLRRVPAGWWVTRSTSAGAITLTLTETSVPPDQNFLTLTPSATATIDLYVF